MAFYIKGKTGEEVYGKYVETDVKFGPFDTWLQAYVYAVTVKDEKHINGDKLFLKLRIEVEEKKEQGNEEGHGDNSSRSNLD